MCSVYFIDMRKICLLLSFILFMVTSASGQNRFLTDNQRGQRSFGRGNQKGNGVRMGAQSDSLAHHNKQIPKGVRMWSVDKRFGDITRQQLDTITHLYPNSVFTSGIYGEYNTTGNLGAPRINRIFINRKTEDGDFLFTRPYSYFTVQPEDFLFTNTYSPYANLSYNNCGNRTNGEDHFEAKFAVNVNKQFGFGFKLNYLYGRGYYSEQPTSLFNLNLYGSYIGDQYQAHLLIGTNNQKITENGGITNDMFITHPESFDDNYSSNEIPTVLERNWNRNKHQHVFFTHRYNIGFHRQVKMTDEEIAARKFAMESKKDNQNNDANRRRKGNTGDEDDYQENTRKKNETSFAGRPDDAKIAGKYTKRNDSIQLQEGLTLDMATADSLHKAQKKEQADTTWMKSEYVPVTSFIHTVQLDKHDRIYQAYKSPANYYADDFYSQHTELKDSIFDQTKNFRLRNTLAFSMLEGFNKWALAGIKLFAASDLRHYSLPDETRNLKSDNTHNFSVGGQLVRTQGKTLHYNVTGETWLLGDEQGQIKIDGKIDLNFPLFKDTVTLVAKGFFHNATPNYYMRHFHARHFWWDNDLSKQTHTHLEGILSYQKTRTTLRFGVDELTKYTYFANTFDRDANLLPINNKVFVRQSDDPITVITASLDQRLRFGIVNWETVATYQKSTKQNILPVPALNLYTTVYIKFRIARVLYTELGGDMRYFTEYEAPDYVPGIGQFAVQENAEKTKIGNYPILSAYANFNLKGTRFFVMYSHANAGSGNKNYFLTPHYPTNGKVLRFGISWNFFN